MTFCERLDYYNTVEQSFETVEEGLAWVRAALAELRDLAPPEIVGDVQVLLDVFEAASTDDLFGDPPPELAAAEERVVVYAREVCGIELE